MRMTTDLIQWAFKYGVDLNAMLELREIFNADGLGSMPLGAEGTSEAAVQSVVRLEAARKGVKLWRNNVGALLDARGVPVRYGLANDSPALNKKIKSGDLIGWRPILITHSHIGTTIAQFVSRECKRRGWVYAGGEHEEAQLKWAQVCAADGADACFATGEGTL
jgi:hypothetical protein